MTPYPQQPPKRDLTRWFPRLASLPKYAIEVQQELVDLKVLERKGTLMRFTPEFVKCYHDIDTTPIQKAIDSNPESSKLTPLEKEGALLSTKMNEALSKYLQDKKWMELSEGRQFSLTLQADGLMSLVIAGSEARRLLGK